MERLSSGFRINRAGDDAAGLAISEKLKAQVRGLNQAARNAQDGISMIQTAEAGLDEVQSIMQRMRELAVQGSNDTMGASERQSIKEELDQLKTELQNISERTKFNNRGLLDGSMRATLDTDSTVTTMSVGTTLSSGTNVEVRSVDVSAAGRGQSFTLSFDSGTNRLTMTDGTNSQSVSLTDVAAGANRTLSFDKLGVKIEVFNGDGTDFTAASLGNDLAGLTLATTSTGEGAVLQTGAYTGDETRVAFLDTRIDDSDVQEVVDLRNGLNSVNVNDRQSFSSLIDTIDSALEHISSQRAKLGAVQNRLETTIANVKSAAENLSASNSRIRDVDVASESAELARGQILMQAGVSVLAQANQMSQLSLKLLG
jgi:flagellin